jgi:hypothetical protein
MEPESSNFFCRFRGFGLFSSLFLAIFALMSNSFIPTAFDAASDRFVNKCCHQTQIHDNQPHVYSIS